jgi:dimethylaniline monooxygenase (N-oxide forming)
VYLFNSPFGLLLSLIFYASISFHYDKNSIHWYIVTSLIKPPFSLASACGHFKAKMPPKVAVIGAGPLGLIALKSLKEDGFEVTGYEARSWAGGLWRYSDDASLSVAENTIFNTSKYRSATSDFPFPDDTNDYPTATQMYQYLESYCDHFDLRTSINFNSRVMNMTRGDGEWILEVDLTGSIKRYDRFDKIVVATGTFNTPRRPDVEGLKAFAGQHMHSINFHNPTQYKDQIVLLVGLQATASDVAMALSGHAKKVYVSHRNGVILVSRSVFDP